MGTINVTTTGVVISPYRRGQAVLLESGTAVYEKITHSLVSTTGFYIKELNIFIVYKMNIEKLKAWFPDYDVVEIPPYGMAFRHDIQMKPGFELRPYQRDVINKIISSNKYETFLNVPTASGKTVMGIWYSVFTKSRTLIMCFSTKILDQWKQSILQLTTAKEKNIAYFSTKLLDDILDGKKDVSNVEFFLTTPNMITSYAKNRGYDSLAEIMKKLQIGLKICDEAHRNIGAIVKLNALTSCKKTLYMSADFNRGSRYARDQFFNVFHHVQKVTLKDEEMQKMRHIVTIICRYNSKPDPIDRSTICKGQYKWSHIEYAKYQFNNNITESKVTKILNKILPEEEEHKPHYKTLILLYLIDHVESLYKTLSEMYKGRFTVGRYHSGMSKEEKQEALKCDIIVSIYGSFSTGVDVTDPEIRHVISTIPVDEVSINQSAGRCRPIKGRMSFLWVLYDQAFDFCSHNKSKISKYLINSKVLNVLEKDIEEI